MPPRTPSDTTLYGDLFLVPHLASSLYGPTPFFFLNGLKGIFTFFGFISVIFIDFAFHEISDQMGVFPMQIGLSSATAGL